MCYRWNVVFLEMHKRLLGHEKMRMLEIGHTRFCFMVFAGYF